MHTIDMTTDPINLTDPADWLAVEHTGGAMPASEPEGLRRTVALALAAPLIERERAGTLPDTPAHRALESLLWGLVANIGHQGDDIDDGCPPTDMTDEDFDAGTRGLTLDGAAVCGSFTVSALDALGEPWRFRHVDGYALVVVQDATGLRLVQPVPGYHDATNRDIPRVPATAPAVATPDELALLVRKHFDTLDRMIGWAMTGERDDDAGMYWCVAGMCNDNPGRPSEIVVDLIHEGDRATLTVDHEDEGRVRIEGLTGPAHADRFKGRVWRLTHEATGARFDVRTSNPYVSGGRFAIDAMDFRAFRMLDDAASELRARWAA